LNEQFALRFGDKDVQFYSMHPGWADTPGVQNSMPAFYEKTKGMLRNDEEGADTIVWLAACVKREKLSNGKFYFDREEASTHLSGAFTQSPDEDVQRLWDECCSLAGVPDFNSTAKPPPGTAATTTSTTSSSAT
jgi:dehydrogenase/reductase SDR family member 12